LSTKNKTPHYETHDYSAVESYLRSQSERRDLANQANAKSAYAHKLKYVALVIASCGFAALLVLYGVSLLKKDRIQVVEKVVEKMVPVEKVVERMVPIEKTNNESPFIRKRLEELEKIYSKQLDTKGLNKKSDFKNKAPSNKPDISTKFNIFKHVPSRIYGFEDVVTGHEYAHSKTTYPERQYCYVQIKTDSVRKAKMILGFKEGRGSVSWEPYTLASSHEISPSQFKSAKSDCQFM
jgi:hypothetical protein